MVDFAATHFKRTKSLFFSFLFLTTPFQIFSAPQVLNEGEWGRKVETAKRKREREREKKIIKILTSHNVNADE